MAGPYAITRRAGCPGPATGAELQQPASAALDAAGDTLIADSGNDRIMVSAAATRTLFRRPVTAGHIYDEAGDGGDGGPGYLAELNGRIREVTG